MHGGQHRGDVPSRSPLIGRSLELQRIDRLYRGAADGNGTFVLMWGEAGVGKTRLLEECASRSAAEGARVVRTACFEDLCPPFTPWREAFAALGVADPFGSAGAVETRASAELERYRSFVAAAEVLGDAANAAAILITIDDLQWADFATLEFLAFATHRMRNACVLVLASMRSEDLEADHTRRAAIEKVRHEGALSIPVQPLADEDIDHLLRSLQPPDAPIDAARLERIRALAEGKPYFAEELLSSALLAPQDGAFDAAPLSIRAGVLSRFERLSAAEREVLFYATVIGRSFDASLLARLTGLLPSDLHRVLARARDLLLTREQRDAAGRFEFRHAITREILYRELLSAQAQAMHRAVAQCLERDDESGAAEIGHHWVASGDHARAAAAFEAAGDEAAARNAYRDAAAAYERAAAAAELFGSPGAQLFEKLCRACSMNGDLKRSCAWGQRALDGYVGENDPRAAAFALFLARRYGDAGLQGDGFATAERALSLLDARDDPHLRYAAHVTLARLDAQGGRIDDALRQLAKAESIPGPRQLGDRHLFYDFRADIQAGRGRLGPALDDSAEAVALAREIGEAERLSITLSNYARFAFFAGRMREAAAAYDEALALAQREHLGRAAAIVGTSLAYVYLLNGDLVAASATLGRQVGGGPAIEAGALAAGLRLAYLHGDDEAARRYDVDAALEAAFRSDQPDAIGLLAGTAGAYFDAVGKCAEADALRSRALERVVNPNLSLWLLDQLGASADAVEVTKARALLERAAADPDHTVAHAHLALFDARAAHRRGDRRAAKRHAQDAAGRFAAIGWPWERAQALEIAGRPAEALELYRLGGYVRDERRLAAVRRRARHRAASDSLTARELEVVRLAVAGKSNREIAQALAIGERTVETHIAAIFDRFDLTSRRQLNDVLEPGTRDGS